MHTPPPTSPVMGAGTLQSSPPPAPAAPPSPSYLPMSAVQGSVAALSETVARLQASTTRRIDALEWCRTEDNARLVVLEERMRSVAALEQRFGEMSTEVQRVTEHMGTLAGALTAVQQHEALSGNPAFRPPDIHPSSAFPPLSSFTNRPSTINRFGTQWFNGVYSAGPSHNVAGPSAPGQSNPRAGQSPSRSWGPARTSARTAADPPSAMSAPAAINAESVSTSRPVRSAKGKGKRKGDK